MTKTKGFRSCWLTSLGGGIVIALAGCGGSAALRAADAGDHDALRASLAAEGEVDAGEARAIARRVLERQIETAQGDSGRRGLDALDEGCIDDFASALGRRASTDDALGAHAARLRMDAEAAPALAYADRVEDRDDDWRAAAARSLTTRAGEVKDPDDSQVGRAGWWRRHLMLDPSTEVRRAALRAAINAADAADSAAVLEAARLDPDRRRVYSRSRRRGRWGRAKQSSP
ncbi:MAG: hypothetical protein R3B72_00040 [Polyangiaceae bacterium]